MKRKRSLILRIAMTTAAASAFCFVTQLNAQENTSSADNPHLRQRDQPKAGTKKLGDKDVHFIQEAATGGVQEIADGKVAEARGNAEVKKIGARMVADHSKANRDLVELAKSKGVAMDTSKGKARDFGKEGFDRQYLVNAEDDHKNAIKTFEKEAASGDDADLKAWAKKTLPTLQAHHAMIKDALKKMK